MTSTTPFPHESDADNGQVYRQGLSRRIIKENFKPVVIVHAPAGHGKSTLLQQLIPSLVNADERVVFLKICEEHNDLSRFFNAFQAALDVGIGDVARPIKRIPNAKSKGVGFTDYLLSQLSLSPHKLNVIFDDFHCLSNRAILTILTDLFDRPLNSTRFIIASRDMPDIALERLLINSKALLLGANDIRFSRDEVEQFVSHWGDKSFKSDDIDFFEEWTHGWPAGLQLLKLVLKDKVSLSILKTKKDIKLPLLTNYLADNVLAVLSAETQDFLLKTSVLKKMSASLCEVVTGYPDCQAMLEYIERSGVFIKAVDKSYQWFSYHNIFASFLKNQLHSQLPETEEAVHRKALDWYREQGMHEESIFHAEAIHDYHIMADILDEWSADLIIKAHLETVEYWYDRLPEESIAVRPSLAVRIAWALIFLRRFNKLDVLLTILDQQKKEGMWADNTSVDIIRAVAALMNDDIVACEKIIESINVEQFSLDDFRIFELSAVANMQALFYLFNSRFDDARELLAISHAYSTNVSAIFSDSYSCGVNGFRLLAEGKANDAFFELEQEASSKKFYLAGAFAASALISCHAWILYERDELAQAREELESSLEVIINACLLDWTVMAFVTLSRIYFVSEEFKKQNSLLKKAEMVGYSRGWKRLIRIVQCERIRSGLLSDNLSLAKSLNSRISRNNNARWPAAFIDFYSDVESDAIRMIRLALYEKDVSGFDSVTSEINNARKLGRKRRLLTLFILKARFEKLKGNLEAAMLDLREAVSLAAPEGYLRCFLDEGRDLSLLLVELYCSVSKQRKTNRELDLAFVEKIISASGMTGELMRVQRRETSVFNEPMTNRERQILQLVATGSSNKDIAKTVFLSENTVKFHLKNIFSKLGVSNRTQAITVARENSVI